MMKKTVKKMKMMNKTVKKMKMTMKMTMKKMKRKTMISFLVVDGEG